LLHIFVGVVAGIMDALNCVVVRAGRVFVLAIFPVDDVVRPSIGKIHLESLYHGIHALVVEVLDCRINNADIPHLAKTQDSDSQRLRLAIPGEYTHLKSGIEEVQQAQT